MRLAIDFEELPSGWVPLEAVAVIKCLDADGEPVLGLRSSDGLTSWECLGMLEGAANAQADELAQMWEEEG